MGDPLQARTKRMLRPLAMSGHPLLAFQHFFVSRLLWTSYCIVLYVLHTIYMCNSVCWKTLWPWFCFPSVHRCYWKNQEDEVNAVLGDGHSLAFEHCKGLMNWLVSLELMNKVVLYGRSDCCELDSWYQTQSVSSRSGSQEIVKKTQGRHSPLCFLCLTKM